MFTQLNTLLQTWDVTVLPPYKNLVPRFLGFRKEGRVLGSKTIFSFLGCFLFRVMRPLDLEELDGFLTSFAFSFIKDTDRILSISEVLLEIKSLVINTTDRIFEATLELGNMEHIMNIRKVCR